MGSPGKQRASEENLERLLHAAIDEPGVRPEFYRALLESDVYVLVPRPSDGHTKVPAGSSLPVINWRREDGVFVIPIFSSLSTLKQGAPQADMATAMSVRDLFSSLRDRHFHLNPNCRFGHSFVPREIELLLANGTVADPDAIKPEEPMGPRTIEEVSNPPADMISSLTTLYVHTPSVEGAYLARAREKAHPEKSTLIVAICADGDLDRIASDSTAVINDTYDGTEPIDLMEMPKADEDAWVNFRQVSLHFYDRSWGQKLGLSPREQTGE